MKTFFIVSGIVFFLVYVGWLIYEIVNAPLYDEETGKFISKKSGKCVDELN